MSLHFFSSLSVSSRFLLGGIGGTISSFLRANVRDKTLNGKSAKETPRQNLHIKVMNRYNKLALRHFCPRFLPKQKCLFPFLPAHFFFQHCHHCPLGPRASTTCRRRSTSAGGSSGSGSLPCLACCCSSRRSRSPKGGAHHSVSYCRRTSNMAPTCRDPHLGVCGPSQAGLVE